MAKKKLKRIREVASFTNVLEAPVELRGHWRERCFKNSAVIILELACGRGEYSLTLAQRFPQYNFIGMDIKGARLWYGAQQAKLLHLSNVVFVRAAIENLTDYFAPGEIAEIWIPFPDPHPTFSRRKRRLTSPRFLQMYRELLEPGGLVHLKTDDEILYEYTILTLGEEGADILQQMENIDDDGPVDERLLIQTKYERKHRKAGRAIKYVRFRL
ncbi:tRNA (guanosine(46)-N7)-methyltransferase TrmB [candidate division KSB1 bacterium]|nr:tRNA (guanosine(46)-N7)-methyltransferase TrmB [candidate division KSB1 bacterium]